MGKEGMYFNMDLLAPSAVVINIDDFFTDRDKRAETCIVE